MEKFSQWSEILEATLTARTRLSPHQFIWKHSIADRVLGTAWPLLLAKRWEVVRPGRTSVYLRSILSFPVE